MSRIVCLLASLVVTNTVQAQTAAEGRPSLPGHTADVEVVVNGTAHYGRLVVTGDGGVHLERLDGEARRWASAVIRRASTPSQGWDDRIDPVRCLWCRLGADAVLAEVHAPAASVVVTRHRPLLSR